MGLITALQISSLSLLTIPLGILTGFICFLMIDKIHAEYDMRRAKKEIEKKIEEKNKTRKM